MAAELASNNPAWGNNSHPIPLAGYNQPNENQQGRIFGSVFPLTIFALGIVIWRTVIRIRMNTVGLDDLFMIFAIALSIVGTVMLVIQVKAGLGQHLFWVVTAYEPNSLRKILSYSAGSGIVYPWAVAFVKLSVGMFLLRFAQTSRFRWFIWGMICFTAISNIACTVAIGIVCKTVLLEYNAGGSSTVGSCFQEKPAQIVSYTQTCCNIITDFIFASLPFFLLRNININLRTKTSIAIILSLGFFAAMSSIVKLHFISKTEAATIDYTWTNTPLISIWNTVECNVGIIAASIPALEPVFKTLLQTTRKYTVGRRTSQALISGFHQAHIHADRIKNNFETIELGRPYGSFTTTISHISQADSSDLESRLPHYDDGTIDTKSVMVRRDIDIQFTDAP